MSAAGPPAEPADAQPPALAVVGVSHRFGAVQALDDVAFAVHRGEFGFLLGRNGAGKTTLFSLITGFYHTGAGSIRILGLDVRENPSRTLARIGVVFQQPAIDLDLSVSQNLRYHAALHGMAPPAARERMEVELGRLEMAGRAHDRMRQLSGGQRRRVEIARALMHRPKLLLLDEPTVGLDVEGRRAILDHVRGLCREDGIAVLWATHLIDEVGPGDRVIVLDEGRVRAFGGAEDITRKAGAATITEAFTRLTGKDGS